MDKWRDKFDWLKDGYEEDDFVSDKELIARYDALDDEKKKFPVGSEERLEIEIEMVEIGDDLPWGKNTAPEWRE